MLFYGCGSLIVSLTSYVHRSMCAQAMSAGGLPETKERYTVRICLSWKKEIWNANFQRPCVFGPVDPDVSKHRSGFNLRFKRSKQLLVGMHSPTIKMLTILQSVVNLSLSDVAARPFLQASSAHCCKDFNYRKKELSQIKTLFEQRLIKQCL